MPNIAKYGTIKVMDNTGVGLTALDIIAAAKTALFSGGTLHVLRIPIAIAVITQAALANNATKEIIAADTTKVWLLTTLKLRSSVAGKVQLLDGTTVFMEIWIPDTNSYQVTLPELGINAAAINTALSLKNVSGGAIDISISYTGDSYTSR